MGLGTEDPRREHGEVDEPAAGGARPCVASSQRLEWAEELGSREDPSANPGAERGRKTP